MSGRRVVVLKGGPSLERQVSLRSASRVEDALEELGYDVLSIDVDSDLVERLREAEADVAFVALHGRGGEDGTVQEILEIVGLPYTGSGVPACIRSMDKVLTKHLLIEHGLPTPDFFAFNETAFREFGAAEALPAIEEQLGFPIVVKPAAQGSALGIKFARSSDDIPEALISAFSYDDKVLLERYVDGREVAVGLLEEAGDVRALPVVEAVPKEGHLFDFEARYEIGKTDYVCPAELPDEVTGAAQDLAIATYRLLGCYGFARVDMILSKEGELQVLEGQAIPGLTETSLLPQAAEAAGLTFEQFVERLVEQALARPGTTVKSPG
jgi:D-alanine-D-alanine ligase